MAQHQYPNINAFIIGGALDVIDRADRLLGIIYGDVGQLAQRAATRDLLVQLRDAGIEYDARLIRLLTALDIVTVNNLLNPHPVDVTDRWARQLGQVDLARVLGAALSAANPVITGVYDTLGNRMPSMDVAARPGYVDVIDRAGRLLGTISPVAGSIWDVSDRWNRQVGQVDIARYLGVAIGLANPLHSQIVFAGAVIDPRSIRSLVSTDVVTSYGSLTQALQQRAATFDLLVQLRNAGVEIDPRSIRALTKATDELYSVLRTDAGVAYDARDVSDRWARQLGLVDLSRVLGAALTSANPVITGLFDAAGNRMPSMDAVARPGYVDPIDRAGRLVGIVYGSLAQLQQRAATFELLVSQETRARLTVKPEREDLTVVGSISQAIAGGAVMTQLVAPSGALKPKVSSVGYEAVAAGAHCFCFSPNTAITTRIFLSALTVGKQRQSYSPNALVGNAGDGIYYYSAIADTISFDLGYVLE